MNDKSVQEPSDIDIVQRVNDGDTEAFGLLVDRYGDAVGRIVARHVPSESVEEVTHDVFVSIYRSLPTFGARSPFGRWISSIAVRGCHDFWRNHYRKREVSLSSLTEDHQGWLDVLLADDSREIFERQAAQREAREVLEYALDRLSADDRMIVTLMHLDGLSVRETADLLGWSSVRVKVRAHRSRQRMKKIIMELIEEGRKTSDEGTS